MSSRDTGCRYKALLPALALVAAGAVATATGFLDADPPPAADVDAVAVVATFSCHGDEPPEDGAGGRGRDADEEYAAGAAGLENVGLALRPSSAKMSFDRFADAAGGAGGGGGCPGWDGGAEDRGGGDKAGRYAEGFTPRDWGDAGGGGGGNAASAA
jgi:hypothetical protein